MLKELSEKSMERKENRWIELTSFVVYYGGELEEDLAFCKLEDYRSGAAFDEEDDSKILYGFNEDEIWDKLFEVSRTTDWDELHMMFKNARWCKHENLMVFSLISGDKLCALKL
ncbi:hypothetical protein [Clostridium beijerinckii]|uniref:Uncharacterized protein n=1 Tax=Clostridium beijerinckii TaxID=1520 RepID=A0AAX0AZU1_CLOBE|nr:hypothetical protein [Clostridium beijerinckii]NRT88555.1 hypothetical protein [Clostridium beijerinckii]NYC74010.1 hypothetical protein [Clostridium beijerinckii]